LSFTPIRRRYAEHIDRTPVSSVERAQTAVNRRSRLLCRKTGERLAERSEGSIKGERLSFRTLRYIIRNEDGDRQARLTNSKRSGPRTGGPKRMLAIIVALTLEFLTISNDRRTNRHHTVAFRYTHAAGVITSEAQRSWGP